MVRRRPVNMTLQCEVCGCIYKWEMFFHNHLRDVHGISVGRQKSKKKRLGKENVQFLENYFVDVCNRPCLEEIETLSEFLGIKKETTYWWFVNRIKREKAKSRSPPLTSRKDVGEKGCVDRSAPGVVKGGKGPKEKRVRREQHHDTTSQSEI